MSAITGGASQATTKRPESGAVLRTVQGKSQEILSVLDFGADPTGASDSGPKILKAMQAAFPGVGIGAGGVYVPPETYLIEDTIDWPSSQGGRLYGNGLGSIFKWVGNTGTPMLNIIDSPLSEISNVQFLYTSAHPGQSAIKIGHGTTGDISAAVDINHVWINGNLYLSNCVVYDGVDANNDFMSIEYSSLTGVTDYAVIINGQNAVGNLFSQVRIAQAYGGVKSTNNGAGMGSFSWYGGTTNTSHASFEFVGYTTYGITLQDGNSEDTGKFIIGTAGVGVGNIIVNNWNWARANINPASPIFIDISGAPVLTLRGGFYKFNDSIGSLAQIKYQHFGAVTSSPTVNLIDTSFETETTTEAGLFASGSTAPTLNYANFENAHWFTTDAISPTGGYYGDTRYRPAGSTNTSGTFTPVLKFGGGTTGITYSTQQGKYTRASGITTVEVKINLTSKGSSTGTASITGLPVNSTAVSVGTLALDAVSGITSPYAYVFAGDSEIFLRQNNSGGIGVLSNTNFGNASEIILTIQVY